MRKLNRTTKPRFGDRRRAAARRHRRLLIEQFEHRNLLASADLLATLNDPSTNPQRSFLGYTVAIDGGYTVVGGTSADLSGVQDLGLIDIFDTNTGALLRTVNSPSTLDSRFGSAIAISSSTIVVGSSTLGLTYLFDAATGSLIRTINSPVSNSTNFGSSVAISGSTIVIGAPDEDTGATDAGSIYVYSATTGALLRTVNNPTPQSGDEFGNAVAISGSTILVGDANKRVVLEGLTVGARCAAIELDSDDERPTGRLSTHGLASYSFPIGAPVALIHASNAIATI